MGCLKLDHLPPLTPLRVVHSKYRKDHTLPKEQAPPEKVTIYLQVWTDQEGHVLRVDAYALNNPLKYTDPTGEYVNFVIGAVVGGFSGFMIGQAKGATGWALFGSTFTGASIGFATAGLGAAVGGTVATGSSVAFSGSLGATAGGAVAGAFSGTSFAALGGGNEGLGAITGGISGGIGGGIGTAIGGGIGAFTGGAVAGGIGMALSNNKDKNVLRGAIIGGLTSYASFEAQIAFAYAQYQKEPTVGNLTHGGFRELSIHSQRSFARGVEGAANIPNDGTVGNKAFGKRDAVVLPAEPGMRGAIHTHTNKYFFNFSTWDIDNNEAYVLSTKYLSSNNFTFSGSAASYRPSNNNGSYIPLHNFQAVVLPQHTTIYQNSFLSNPFFLNYYGQ